MPQTYLDLISAFMTRVNFSYDFHQLSIDSKKSF